MEKFEVLEGNIYKVEFYSGYNFGYVVSVKGDYVECKLIDSSEVVLLMKKNRFKYANEKEVSMCLDFIKKYWVNK